MAERSRSQKKSGSTRSVDTGDKDLIAELKDHIAVLENELRLKNDQTVLDITKRKQTIEKPEEKERLLRKVFECVQDGVSVLDKDLNILQVNPTMEKWYGEHITGNKCYQTYHGRSEPCDQCPSIRAIKTGSTQTGIVHDIKGWREIYAFPIVNDRGEVTGVIEHVRDINERKRAEAALRNSEEKYRELVENANSIIIRWDTQGNLSFFNEYAEKLFGYSKNEVLGRNVVGTIVPLSESTGRDLAALMEDVERYPERYKLNVNENMCKNGDRVWIAWTNQAIFNEHGTVVEILSVGNDITERKKAEAELERVNRSLKAISKCNEAVVHAKEESALLNHVCQIIAEVGGYRMTWVGYAENDANRTVRPMAYNGFEDGYMAIVNVTWEDTERGRGPVGSAIRTGKPCVIRYATTDPNFLPWREDALKRGYNSVLGLPLIQDGHSFGALAIYSEQPDAFDEKETIMLQDLANNLTYGIISLRNEVKRAEAESALKAAKADAELYVDLMGHDINNMNQISLGFLELAHNIIDMNGKLGEDDVVLLNKAMDSLNNSSQLIDNVRKLQKEKMGMYRLEVIDVGAVIEDAAKQFHRIPDREIKINYSPDQHCLVNANGLLKDVFINLIGNAVKHSKGDLVINILMGEVIDDAKTYCCVDVEDNGPGIPDMLKTTLFDRLNLTTTRAKGKGFGLCLIKMLVDDYHGRFWVEDRVQGDHTKGARFVVMLPVVEK